MHMPTLPDNVRTYHVNGHQPAAECAMVANGDGTATHASGLDWTGLSRSDQHKKLVLHTEQFFRAAAIVLHGGVIGLADAKRLFEQFQDNWDDPLAAGIYQHKSAYALKWVQENAEGTFRPSTTVCQDTERLVCNDRGKLINVPFKHININTRDINYYTRIIATLESSYREHGDVKLAWSGAVESAIDMQQKASEGVPTDSACHDESLEAKAVASHKCSKCRHSLPCLELVIGPNGLKICALKSSIIMAGYQSAPTHSEASAIDPARVPSQTTLWCRRLPDASQR